jgi:hypothetical protein
MWMAYYASLPLLDLSVAAVALYTSPLMIALLSALVIGEPVGPRRWAAIAIGFAGVLAILRPGTDAFSWIMLLPILGAAFYAMAMILTRSKCLGEPPLALALALNVSLLAAGLIMSGVLWALDLGPEVTAAHPFVLGPWAEMGAREWGIAGLRRGRRQGLPIRSAVDRRHLRLCLSRLRRPLGFRALHGDPRCRDPPRHGPDRRGGHSGRPAARGGARRSA